MLHFRRDPSVASSVTLGRTTQQRSLAPTPSSAIATAGSEDVEMTDAGTVAAGNCSKRWFIIAVDYGTTNSSASYAIANNSRDLRREQVQYITNYPNDPVTEDPCLQISSNEVPSEVWYPNEEIRNANPFGYNIAGTWIGDGGVDEEENIENDFEDQQASNRGQGRSKTYDRIVPAITRWGFDAQPSATFSKASEFLSYRNSPIKWAKLQLASGQLRTGYPMKTRKSFNVLRRHGIVRKELDFITDFLTCFFKHIKAILEENHELNCNDVVEMVLCVPVIWSCKARRDMHAAMAVAIKNSGLGTTSAGCVDNLFIVSEPEAAAAYVLDEEYEIMLGDTFVLLDAGGGTVDAITYTVTNTEPLRLKSEAVEPGGKMCGSSFLNEDFRTFVKERLKDERYLWEGEEGLTLDDIVDERIMKDFENRIKRRMDFQTPRSCNFCFDVPNLKPNEAKRFLRWTFPVNQDEFFGIFEPRMNEVAALMEEQIDRCREANIDVHKVVLIGGYGDNRALQTHLARKLEEISLRTAMGIQLKTASEFGRSATAVSAGAVLRAFNKDDGPVRKLQSSYGLLRKELRNLEFEGHRKARSVWDKLEGDRFVKDTIFWVFQKGETVAAKPKPKFIGTEHTFPLNKPCIVKEEFFVSDVLIESHWQVDSSKNKGKFDLEGTFVLDLSDWRERGLMRRVVPEPGKPGEEHWAVDFDIVMELVGRKIRCSARYPRIIRDEIVIEHEIDDNESEEIPGSQVHVSIAAAFEPGTK